MITTFITRRPNEKTIVCAGKLLPPAIATGRCAGVAVPTAPAIPGTAKCVVVPGSSGAAPAVLT